MALSWKPNNTMSMSLKLISYWANTVWTSTTTGSHSKIAHLGFYVYFTNFFFYNTSKNINFNIMSKESETQEALIRIVVAIVTGIILSVWKVLIFALAIVNLFITLFTGKRNKDIADFCEIWNTQLYVFVRYVTFVTNERPFPFKKMSKNISKFER